MPSAHVCTETIAGAMRLRTPYRGIETGRDTLRITVTIETRSTVESCVVIEVDDLAVEVRADDGAFVLGASTIDALFVVERQPRRGFLPWFGVFARKRGTIDQLVVETPEPQIARFVERTIESWLGLGDTRVRGELRVASRRGWSGT